MAILVFGQLYARFPVGWQLGKIIYAAVILRADVSAEIIDEVTKLPDGTNATLPERTEDLFLIIQTEDGEEWLDLRESSEAGGLPAGTLVSCGIPEDLQTVGVALDRDVPERYVADYRVAVKKRMRQYSREFLAEAAKVAPPPDPELPPDEP